MKEEQPCADLDGLEHHMLPAYRECCVDQKSRKSRASSDSSSSSGGEVLFDYYFFPDLFPYETKGGSIDLGVISSMDSKQDASSSASGFSSCEQSLSTGDAPSLGNDLNGNDAGNSLIEAKKPLSGQCNQCGTNTHLSFGLFMLPLTNKNVYQGNCIQCLPHCVPMGILQEWQQRNQTPGVRGCAYYQKPQKTSLLLRSKKEAEKILKVNDGIVKASNKRLKTKKQTKEKSAKLTSFSSPTSSLPVANAIMDSRLDFQVAEPVPWNEIIPVKAKKGCYCNTCGVVKTHRKVLGARFPLTNRQVKRGCCRQCSCSLSS